MFFIGLASSIIPYVLISVVMVILTLGSNAEVLKKLSITSEPTKAIVLDTNEINPASVPSVSNANIHWTDHVNQQLSGSFQTVKPALLPPLPQMSVTSILPPPLSHYRSINSARYFGLSPPCAA